MPDATVKLSDGIREITVEYNGTDDDPLARAEETAIRLYDAAIASHPTRRGHPATPPNERQRSSA
ncbi:hypothetical protein OH540_09195 [Streptomyces sp. BPPL-273]|uniref:hypothetical protein n=1 Tax=Streptomyces sp. BPPL-273 TaxID=2987533 RepID=UPI0024AECC7C|nr:hypothetical protein [Streptomyces sp. BPPL-273]WHM30196.1 hypothetical protein OH540_09195 [Streptomyces sp. BPPL-273]